MYSLAFDTTGSACSIILLSDSLSLDKYSKSMDFGQSEVLIPEIKNLLEKNNLTFSNINAVFVCVGPGSFTGVRSSISAARVFAIANPRLKLGGISAFDSYLYTLDEEDLSDINAVIIETHRDDFYIQLFDHHLNKISSPQALSYADSLSMLKDQGKLVTLIGDGVERFLSRPSGLNIHTIKMFDNLPIEALAKAGLKKLVSRKLDFPKPLYIRAPYCQKD